MTEANKELPDWQQRLIREYDDLKVKVNGLSSFIGSVPYQGLDVNHQILLKTQLLHMRGYLVTLGYRIDLIGIAESVIEEFDDESQRLEATRLAVLRAAAEVGRVMP